MNANFRGRLARLGRLGQPDEVNLVRIVDEAERFGRASAFVQVIVLLLLALLGRMGRRSGEQALFLHQILITLAAVVLADDLHVFAVKCNYCLSCQFFSSS